MSWSPINLQETLERSAAVAQFPCTYSIEAQSGHSHLCSVAALPVLRLVHDSPEHVDNVPGYRELHV